MKLSSAFTNDDKKDLKNGDSGGSGPFKSKEVENLIPFPDLDEQESKDVTHKIPPRIIGKDSNRGIEVLHAQFCLIVDGSSGNQELETRLAQLLQQVYETFKIKLASYGSGSISEFGTKGVLVRMMDKMQRLLNILWEDKDDPLSDETIEDTLIDLADYALILIMVRDGTWPNVIRK